MTGPILATSLYSVELPNPSGWKLQNLVGEAHDKTINGTEVTDVFYRKYGYTLNWDAILDTDYNNLLQVLEHHIDRGAELTFTWGKFPQASSGIKVLARLPERSFRAGKGPSGYYSSIELNLVDSSNRQ